MQVIEVNASFITTLISCFAVIACVLVGVLLGLHFRKKQDEIRRRKDIEIKSLKGMIDYEVKKAESKGYESGFEVGYQQAMADIKSGKVEVKKNGPASET